MVKVVEDERSRIRYLERRLNENGFYLPSSLVRITVKEIGE
ncbi:hypothetical protein T3Z92_25635 [Escherichia coli]|nr:hypothetical protein [Escherichia coli]MDZ3845729.1 hypothetical protein [Escherichia coli]